MMLAAIIMAVFVFAVLFPRITGRTFTPKRYKHIWHRR